MIIFAVYIVIMFVGEHIAKLDDKGRLVFPAPLKATAEGERTVKLRFVLKKDLFSHCLEMFVYEEWEQESEKVKGRLNFFNRDHAAFWREYMRDRAVVEPDEKMGRITIPKRLLDMIGVQKEVVFSGNGHKLEVWAKERFEEAKIEESVYVALAEKILG